MPGHAPGFSFALHLLRVQGFYFALSQYSRIQAFTARFAVSMQLYRPRHVRAHTRARTPCTDTSYQTPRRTLCSSAQTAYYNNVYKGAAVRTLVMDPCQTVQHITDHASPAGSRCFPRLALAWHCAFFLAGGAEPLAACAASLFGLSPDS